MSRRLPILWLGLCAWGAILLPAQASDRARTEQVDVRLVAEQPSAGPGETLWLGVRFELSPHWHVYWRNPGDSGEAPRVEWRLPDGWTAGEIHWPVPSRIPVEPFVNYGYEDQVTLLVPISVPADAKLGEGPVEIQAHAHWLVCREHCIPQEARLQLQLPVGRGVDAKAERIFEPVRATWPVALDGQATYHAGVDGLQLEIADFTAEPGRVTDVWFAAHAWGPIAPSLPQPWTLADQRLRVALPAGDAPLAKGENLEGLLVITEETADGPVTRGFTLDARPAVATPGTGLTLGVAVAFALLGGLILNLMPCVLPVLSIKVLNLVQQAAEPSARTSAARHGLAFAAGVLTTFLALASLLIGLRAGGASLGWGFQLQEPGIVIALMVLMLALGMNLSGVYSLGGRLAGVGQGLTEGKGLGATFATGVLAVIVASPCTAPFMGAALGFALTRSALETYLVFTALALGFALPLTLLSAWPGWLRLLPVPGPWMERLRNALAFPVYATAAWLLWVLTQQVDSTALGSALAGSLVLAFALWWLGQPMRSSLLRHAATGAMLLTASGLLVAAGRGPSVLTATAASGSDTWSRDRVASLRAAGTPLLVNFTAAWCITCKVNERVALSTPSVRQALIERGITYLKGDWTRRDAEITRELQRHGRSGVPLYLLYPPGEGPPRVLPQLLTEGLVLEAFEQTL